MQRAKEALAHEEQRQKAIDLRTAQILKTTQSSQQQISVAEARYKQAKNAAINAAAVAIERAAIARKQAEGAAQQKLGANHDKFIDLNPPSVPTSQKDPFADLDPPIVKAKARREHKTQHLSKVQSADAKVRVVLVGSEGQML